MLPLFSIVSVFLYTVPVEVFGQRSPGSNPCVDVFNKPPGSGFSIVLKNRVKSDLELYVFWSTFRYRAYLNLDTRAIYSDRTINYWAARGTHWGKFISINGDSDPENLRVFKSFDENYHLELFAISGPMGNVSNEFYKVAPKARYNDIINWSNFSNHHVFVYQNDNGQFTHWLSPGKSVSSQPPGKANKVGPKLTILDINEKGQKTTALLLITYEHLWTLRNVKFGDPILPWRDSRWYTTLEFFRCPRKVCFDGHIDAAYHDGKRLVMYIGGSRALVDDEPDSNVKEEYHEYLNKRKSIKAITAAVLLLFQGQQSPLVFFSDGRVNKKERGFLQSILFPNITDETVIDAAFLFENNLTLITGYFHTTWSVKRDLTFELVSAVDNKDRWPGIFKHVDAAYVKQAQVVFISDCFYMSANVSGDEATEPKLIQNNLFKCPDTEYQKPIIGINNFNDYQNYINQFKVEWFCKPANTTTLVPTDSTSINSSSTLNPSTKSTTKSSKAAVVIIVLVTLLIVVTVVGLIIFNLTQKRKTEPAKSSSSIESSKEEPDNRYLPYEMSQETLVDPGSTQPFIDGVKIQEIDQDSIASSNSDK